MNIYLSSTTYIPTVLKKKKAASVCSESAPLNSAVLGESVKSGRESSLEGGGAGIKRSFSISVIFFVCI